MTSEMQWGKIFYWMGTFVAGVLVLWVVRSYVFTSERGEPIVQIVPLALAAIIWLAGLACRYLFAGR